MNAIRILSNGCTSYFIALCSVTVAYILWHFLSWTLKFSPSLQINEMTKELDALLAYIEKDGGFRDACITFQQRPLSAFEDGLQNFMELLQVFKVYHYCERSHSSFLNCLFVVLSVLLFQKLKPLLNVCACFNPQNKVEGQCSKIEDLRNKMFQGEPFLFFLGCYFLSKTSYDFTFCFVSTFMP